MSLSNQCVKQAGHKLQGRVGTFLSQIRRAPLKFRSRGTATKPRQSVHTVVVVEECVVDGSTYGDSDT